MTWLVAGSLVVTLVITIFALTRGARPAAPRPAARAERQDDGPGARPR